MESITKQTTLDIFFKINVQDTIPNYMEKADVRVWDKHVSLRSRKHPNFEITCDYINKAFVSKTESLVICNYKDNRPYSKRGLCEICPLERTKGIWLPVGTEERKRPVFVSFRQMNKFWNWKKE